MEMKISSVCPHCGKDIVITGVKLTFDNPDKQHTYQPEPLKSKLRGYVGWDRGNTVNDIIIPKEQDDNKSVEQLNQETEDVRQAIIDKAKYANVAAVPGNNTIRIDNSAPDADVNKLLGEEIKKQEEDPNPNNLKVEPIIPKDDVIEENRKAAHEDNIRLQNEKLKKEEDELIPLLKKELIPLLAEKISPDLHILSEALIKQAEESRKKGLCLLCNKNPSNSTNSICDSCLSKYITDNVKQEEESKSKTVW